MLFWYLLSSGRSSLYLSSRTDWVVPVGAILLTVAALGRLVSARVTHREILDRRAAWGYGVIVLPVVAVLVLPPAALGSYAATRRSSFVGPSVTTSTDDIARGDLTLAEIAGALQSRSGMRALGRRAGSDVTMVGFVTREEGTPANEFVLTRFLVSCCVADALSVQVRVVGAPPGEFKTDDWVRVTGAVYPLSNEAVVDASEVEGVSRPREPYLTP
ncbi:MAG: TIGR03943 family protein [Actinobacteria bacterium]|nr:TIGR03943 family protein [Actinomycetota bacterium]